jgi:Ca2+-binding RTX toxin-like protein
VGRYLSFSLFEGIHKCIIGTSWGLCIVNSGDGNDGIAGRPGNDVLNGNAGDDIIRGGSGNDQTSVGDGNDVVTGCSQGQITLIVVLEMIKLLIFSQV